MTPPITGPYDTINFTESVLPTSVSLNGVIRNTISLTEKTQSTPTYTIVPEFTISLDEALKATQPLTETGLNVDDYTVSAVGMWDYVLFGGKWNLEFSDNWNGAPFG